MFERSQEMGRTFIGHDYDEVIELPDLIDVQLSSYEKFLQREALVSGGELHRQGLEEVFQTIFPIESTNGELMLDFDYYNLDFTAVKLTEAECKRKGLTFGVPIKARVNLIFQSTGEIRQKDIYMGDLPLMTNRGTFIINGAE
ncbi:MAG: DNA-directed RNA polymerase subunit beta, partial [Spirochaetes bacterium]